MAFKWTPERADKAKELYLGGMSATEIAKLFGGLSRSAVLGKLHRLGVVRKADENYRQTMRFHAAMRAAADLERQKRKAERQAKAEAKKRLSEERQAARLIKISEKRNEWKEDPMPVRVECSPRPWTERKFGECAFPVEGEGADTKSCCNEVYKEGQYCRGHFRVMFTPAPKREVKAPCSPLNFQNEPRRRRDDVEAELYFAA